MLAVDAVRHPSRLTQLSDRRHPFRRPPRVVEDVDRAVVTVAQPQFRLVRRQADAVAWTPVPLDGPFLVALDLDTVEHLAGRHVTDLEPEQLVDVHVDAGL